jgi:hypothetical protein
MSRLTVIEAGRLTQIWARGKNGRVLVSEIREGRRSSPPPLELVFADRLTLGVERDGDDEVHVTQTASLWLHKGVPIARLEGRLLMIETGRGLPRTQRGDVSTLGEIVVACVTSLEAERKYTIERQKLMPAIYAGGLPAIDRAFPHLLPGGYSWSPEHLPAHRYPLTIDIVARRVVNLRWRCALMIALPSRSDHPTERRARGGSPSQ